MNKELKIHGIRFWLINLIWVLSLGWNTSCNDDEFYINDIGSTLEIKGDFKMSKFVLEEGKWEVPDSVARIKVRLQSLTDNSIYEYDVDVVRETGKRVFRMLIPKNERIEDSDYLMKGFMLNGRPLGQKFQVTFKGEMLNNIMSVEVVYPLDGSGTADDPYLIKSLSNFKDFRFALFEDSITNASGLYFKQTIDLENDGKTGVESDHLYVPYSFAGIYDGDGHKLTYEHIGNVQEVGLFKVLLDGAVVKNLKLEAIHSKAGISSGGVAGKAIGNIRLENLEVKSIIITESADQIGGFIGQVKGDLTLKDCVVRGVLTGHNNLGGVVGSFQDGTLSIQNLSSPKNNLLTISGYDGVGFIAGNINNAILKIDIAEVIHTTSEGNEKNDILEAYKNLGGMIGKASLTKASYIKNAKFEASMKAKNDYVGGLIGSLTLNNADLSLACCVVDNSQIKANNYLGGFFGECSATGSSTVILDKQPNDENITNRFVASSLEGNKYLGGLFGKLSGKLDVKCKVEISGNIKSEEGHAGSIMGEFRGGTLTAKTEYFDIARTVSVKGNSSVGGLVGWAENATIEGEIIVSEEDTIKSIPDSTSFIPIFRGKVDDAKDNGKGKYMGGIVGSAYNTKLEGLCFSGTVLGACQVGGIAGFYKGEKIKNCVNRASTLRNAHGLETGGIAGKIECTGNSLYQYLINYTKIEGQGSTGGLVGEIDTEENNHDIVVEWIVNVGNVSGIQNVGGIVGKVYESNTNIGNLRIIRRAGNYGDVSCGKANMESNIGGILGWGDSRKIMIHHSANHGDISNHTECDEYSTVGGIVGHIGIDPGLKKQHDNSEIKECCNFGKISGSSAYTYAGGLIGYKEEAHEDPEWWSTKDSYNMGEVETGDDRTPAGIVGFLDWQNVVKRCYNVGKVNNGHGIIGETKGTAKPILEYLYVKEGSCSETYNSKIQLKSDSDMKNEGTYKGFDFINIWEIDNNGDINNGYPYLKTDHCPFQFIKPL